MLSVRNVTKKYGSFTALQNVDLQFENGVYALLAPNGAGKTTLMKMLATLMYPTEGEILWNGEDIFRMDEDYRDLLGFLPQKFGFYKGYTVHDFLRYLATLKGLKKQDAEKRIDALLQEVGLADCGKMKMKKLSGGMLQRVGIAQALLNDPKILILDEPTAGLDPKERVRFRNMLSQLGRSRIVILSTHIVSDVESVANRVILIKDHRLLANASVSNLCHILNGKVFELPAAQTAPSDAVFLSERQDGTGLFYRYAAEVVPAGAPLVSATLEDVFLYVYREEMQA